MNDRTTEANGAGIAQLFNLRRDLDDADAIDASVRAGVDVAGTNLWVLFFAILVASVGLNVNSTAVIIGAMLISPLMGPIVGVGYGLAVQDMRLIRRALRNLAIFGAISLLTSTLYFLVSPLRDAGSELLARAQPTLWDVLIAFFGGAAGIVALTRRSISNVAPGVAIATALMPPICTVGFSLARGNWANVAGAFYLFLINSVFIAFATFVFVKLIKLPLRADVSERVRTHARAITTVVVLGVFVPSAVLAYRLVQEQRFVGAATAQIDEVARVEKMLVLDRDIDAGKHEVRVTLVGDRHAQTLGADMAARLTAMGFADSKVELRFTGAEHVDVGSLTKEVRQQVLALSNANANANANADVAPDYPQLLSELKAQFPGATGLAIGMGAAASADAASAPVSVTMVDLVQHEPLPQADRERIERWLAVRLPGRAVRVTYSNEK
ncbi:MAG TPA: DUF389 domain-containing protein [Burkholderiaceae bacterium]|jgi:uncharacterized hydrophobic protein (TIGR00271 family)